MNSVPFRNRGTFFVSGCSCFVSRLSEIFQLLWFSAHSANRQSLTATMKQLSAALPGHRFSLCSGLGWKVQAYQCVVSGSGVVRKLPVPGLTSWNTCWGSQWRLDHVRMSTRFLWWRSRQCLENKYRWLTGGNLIAFFIFCCVAPVM